MKEQCVDERAARDARARVDRHAARLVDDGDVLVLIDDIDGNVLGLRLDGHGCGDVHRDKAPRLQDMPRLDGDAVRKDVPLVRQFFDGGAGQSRLFR